MNKVRKGYQITFDTTGFIGNYPIEAATAPGGADAIFIMGYDFRTGSSTTSGSIAALKGPAFDVGDAVAQYAARVPASIRLSKGASSPWSADRNRFRRRGPPRSPPSPRSGRGRRRSRLSSDIRSWRAS